MRCFSILGLMGLVLALAVGIAALRGANEYWAGGLLLATLLTLCTALIGGLCGAERSRAERLGFAILGGGYFALAFLGLSEGNLARLPTSQLLWYVHERVAPPLGLMVSFTSEGQAYRNLVLVPDGGMVATTKIAKIATPGTAGPANTPNIWRQLLPGAAGYDAFQTVGHCLFALLAALTGGLLGRWFHRTNRADAAA